MKNENGIIRMTAADVARICGYKKNVCGYERESDGDLANAGDFRFVAAEFRFNIAWKTMSFGDAAYNISDENKTFIADYFAKKYGDFYVVNDWRR